MDRVTIIGVYGFLGYSLCTAMLENGYEVTGVYFEEFEADRFLEEKQLEIGRNANFFEVDFKDWLENFDYVNDQGSILFSLYDLFIRRHEKIILESKTVQQLMQKQSVIKSNFKNIILLPAEYAEISQGRDESTETAHFKNWQAIYLPTLFGPWQSEEYYFQKVIHHSIDENVISDINNREWLIDAIYIEDCVQEILKVINEDGDGDFLFKSGFDNNWLNCASYLSSSSDKQGESIKNVKFKSDIIPRAVSKSTPIKKGLDLQKKHFIRLLNGEM